MERQNLRNIACCSEEGVHVSKFIFSCVTGYVNIVKLKMLLHSVDTTYAVTNTTSLYIEKKTSSFLFNKSTLVRFNSFLRHLFMIIEQVKRV